MQLRFLIKAPPTDRLWVGFHERPTMTMEVTPVVAETAVKFEFVRSFLERLLGDMLSVVMVLPFMDDYPLPEVPEHMVHAAAEPLPPAASSSAAAAAAPAAVSSSDGAASPSPSAVTPLVAQPHSAPALAGPAALSTSALVAGGATDVSFDDDLFFDDAVDLGRGASRHARESSSDSQSDQTAGGAETARRASLSGTAVAAVAAAVSAGSAASGSISSSLTSASSASLVDRAALNAAELRRRAVNASSSLAQTVIAKANARLGKAPSLPGSTAAAHGSGPGLGPVSPKRRQDSLTDMPTPSVDDVDIPGDTGGSGQGAGSGSGSGAGSGQGAGSGSGSGAGSGQGTGSGSGSGTGTHPASSHPADGLTASTRVPPPPPLALAAPSAPIPVPVAAPVQLSPTPPSSA